MNEKGTWRSSLSEIERALHTLASRESRYHLYQRLAARSSLALVPLSCWLQLRFQDQASLSQEDPARRLHASNAELSPPLEQLINSGLVATSPPAEGQASTQLTLTITGRQALVRLGKAYHECLSELLDGWSPEQEAELAALLRRLAKNLLSEDTHPRLVAEAARVG